MNPTKRTGIVIGFYLAISVASLATSGLAWFITSRQANVRVSEIGVVDKRGRLLIELGEEENEAETTPISDINQTEYSINDPLIGDNGGGRKIAYVDIFGSPSGITLTPKRAPGELILRVFENDGTGTQDYYFDPYDSNSDGNEDGVTFNKPLPAGASSLEINYSYDITAAYASTKAMNINLGHPDYGPVGTKDSLTIRPESICDISSDGENFYRNTMSPNGEVISVVSNLTGREKVYGVGGVGSYVQFTFWVINESEGSIPVDIAISKNDDDDLLSVENDSANTNEHYRMAIYNTDDPANPEQVFFYEQKNWEASDHYVTSTNLVAGLNTVSYIGEDDIVDGSSFQSVGSSEEAGVIPLPNNQLLYSGLRGGEHASLTVRLWCEGTLCDNADLAQICNANFKLVGYDHI